MKVTVGDALRRFLPDYLREHGSSINGARRRAVWAITHCRTEVMGGSFHACSACNTHEFYFHSCNHPPSLLTSLKLRRSFESYGRTCRSCPQCGKDATAQWVERELSKRVGAPYFMVTF